MASGDHIKILTLSDSVTKDFANGIEVHQKYHHYLETWLIDQGFNVEVMDSDIGKDGIGHALERIEQDIIHENADIVTLMFGTTEAYINRNQTEPRVPIETFERQLDSIIKKLITFGIHPIIMAPPPLDQSKETDREPYRSKGLNFSMEKYVLAAQRMALINQVPFVNVFKEWLMRAESGQDISSFYVDGMHPGPLGHMLIAQKISPTVVDIIHSLQDPGYGEWDPYNSFFWDDDDSLMVEKNSVILDPEHYELRVADMPVGPDFTWSVYLDVDPYQNCHISLNIGENYFDIRHFSHSMVFGGPNIDGSVIEPEDGLAFLSGDTLLLKLESKDGILAFSVNGTSYFSDTIKNTISGLMSLRTRKGTIRIHRMHTSGDMVAAARKPDNFTIPFIDLDGKPQHQVIVDREHDQYLGHPTTVLLDDKSSMIAVYPKGHGRGPIIMKKSTDAGLTWSERIPVPASWATSKEVPTIYKMSDKNGKQRLIMFSGLYPIRMAYSEDEGKTWSELEAIGDYGGIVAISDIVKLRNGDYLAFFHDDGRFIYKNGRNTGEFFVYQIRSADGGLTWSYPEIVTYKKGAGLCEPGIIKSPNGREWAILLRENFRRYNSMIIFSNDEGRSWSEPVELPASLTGDRHQLRYTPDGRIVAVFRDMCRESPTWGDFVGWVGRYDDLLYGKEGQYRFRLGDNTRSADTGYPGLEVLPDGTVVATTYGHWEQDVQPYIKSYHFKLTDLDREAEQLPDIIDVFISGEEGYHTYRIPSIMTLSNGTILAFCEGRASLSDHAQNDIVMKKSQDGGITWGPLMVLAEQGDDCLNNPTNVEIKETGRILLMFQVYKNGYDERRSMPGYRKKDPVCRTKIMFSDDEGQSWSPPQDITKSVKRKEVVTSTASGPGIGIQLERGPYTGRVVIPFNQGPYNYWKVYTVFSDNQGKTWNMGEVAPEDSKGLGNEVQVAELQDGSILLNSRSANGNNFRKNAISHDGGFSWSGLRDDTGLPEPQCQGSLLRFNFKDGTNPGRILFANPASKTGRIHGTIRISYDEGATWPVAKLIYNGSYAYSCLTKIDAETVGLFFERDEYSKISFTRIGLSWLEGQ